MDSLLTQLARCCKPVPPDPIRGFVTRGKGVSIHRENCEGLKRLAELHRRAADTSARRVHEQPFAAPQQPQRLLRSHILERLPVKSVDRLQPLVEHR